MFKAGCVDLKLLPGSRAAIGTFGVLITTMTDSVLPFTATLASLSKLVPEALLHPRVGVVCGSGLSTLASSLTDAVYIPYAGLEGFGASTGYSLSDSSASPIELIIPPVHGHRSSLVFGFCTGVPVVAMLGRVMCLPKPGF